MDVTFIGLGAMGWPMAERLVGSFTTSVWNRTPTVATAHAQKTGSTALVELVAAVDTDTIVSCLPTTADVRAIAEDAEAGLRRGSLWIDCTSGDPAESRDLAGWLAARGVTYVDAPVSGGPTGAAAGTLTVMVGGAAGDVERARPVLAAFGARIVHVGPLGSGHAVKAVNNTLLAANLVTATEGLVALAKSGVDPEVALEVLNGSSGRSFATESTIPVRVLAGDRAVAFKLGLLDKDVGIAMRVLEDASVAAPVLRLVRELLRDVTAREGRDVDHTEIVHDIADRSGSALSGTRATARNDQ